MPFDVRPPEPVSFSPTETVMHTELPSAVF
jgi:hypothetical protein